MLLKQRTFNLSNFSKFYKDNETKNSVLIENLTKAGDSKVAALEEFEKVRDGPSQTINGIVVYTKSVNSGKNIGQPVYASFVENKDLDMLIRFSSPDPNETAKMTFILKFNILAQKIKWLEQKNSFQPRTTIIFQLKKFILLVLKIKCSSVSTIFAQF